MQVQSMARRVWESPLGRTALFAAGGAVAGWAYWALVGCRAGGTCAITASPWRTAVFFGFAAAVAGFPGPRKE